MILSLLLIHSNGLQGLLLNICWPHMRRHVCVCVCDTYSVCAYGGQRLTLGVILWVPYTLFLKPGSPLNLSDSEAGCAASLRDLTASTSPELGLQVCAAMPNFFHGSFDQIHVLMHTRTRLF